jgi:hypothetical protein
MEGSRSRNRWYTHISQVDEGEIDPYLLLLGAGPAHALYFATYERVKEKVDATGKWKIPAAGK